MTMKTDLYPLINRNIKTSFPGWRTGFKWIPIEIGGGEEILDLEYRKDILPWCNAVFLGPHMSLSRQVESTIKDEPQLLFMSEMEVSSL